MSKTPFKMPARPVTAEAEAWVGNAAPAPATQPDKPARKQAEKPARLTIDLPPDLHAHFKAACALKKTGMVEVVREFIEGWIQKNR
jgi:hypothetical protein